MTWPVKAALAITKVVLIVVGFIVFSILAMNFLTKRPVKNEMPEAFPVVAFWSIRNKDTFQARVIDGDTYEAFKKDHPDLSFLMPEGGDTNLKAQLLHQANEQDQEFAKQYGRGHPWYVSAQLQSQKQDYQDWSVEFHRGHDHVNTSFYRAFKNSFTPLYLRRFFGPGFIMFGCPVLLIIYVPFVFLISWLVRRLKKRLGVKAMDVTA